MEFPSPTSFPKRSMAGPRRHPHRRLDLHGSVSKGESAGCQADPNDHGGVSRSVSFKGSHESSRTSRKRITRNCKKRRHGSACHSFRLSCSISFVCRMTGVSPTQSSTVRRTESSLTRFSVFAIQYSAYVQLRTRAVQEHPRSAHSRRSTVTSNWAATGRRKVVKELTPAEVIETTKATDFAAVVAQDFRPE